MNKSNSCLTCLTVSNLVYLIYSFHLDPPTFTPSMSSTTGMTATTLTLSAVNTKLTQPSPLVLPIVITTTSTDNLRNNDNDGDGVDDGDATDARQTSDGSDYETETYPLRTGECETRFGGGGGPIMRPDPVALNPAGQDVTFLAPFQRISALTPAAAGFVGTIQRRLSTANTSISEGKSSLLNRCHKLLFFRQVFQFFENLIFDRSINITTELLDFDLPTFPKNIPSPLRISMTLPRLFLQQITFLTGSIEIRFKPYLPTYVGTAISCLRLLYIRVKAF